MSEYVSSFIYCDTIKAEMTPMGIKHRLVNPLQVITPIAIPSNYSFTIACSVTGLDTNKENNVSLILNLNDKKIYEIPELKIPKEEKISAKKFNIVQFNMDMRNVPFLEEGICETVILVNEKEIGRYKIQVMVGDKKWME